MFDEIKNKILSERERIENELEAKKNFAEFSSEYLNRVFEEWSDLILVAEEEDGSYGTSLAFSHDSREVGVDIEYWDFCAIELLSKILNRPKGEIEQEVKQYYSQAGWEYFSIPLPEFWKLKLRKGDFSRIKLIGKDRKGEISLPPEGYSALIEKLEVSASAPIILSVSQDGDKRWRVSINQGEENLIRYTDFKLNESIGKLERPYTSAEESDAASEVYLLVQNGALQLDENGRSILDPDKLPQAVEALSKIYFHTKLADLKEKLQLSEKFWPRVEP